MCSANSNAIFIVIPSFFDEFMRKASNCCRHRQNCHFIHWAAEILCRKKICTYCFLLPYLSFITKRLYVLLIQHNFHSDRFFLEFFWTNK